MGTPQRIIQRPVATLQKLGNIDSVCHFQETHEGRNLVDIAKALGQQLVTIASMTLPAQTQHSGDGGMVDMVAANVIYLANFKSNKLQEQVENLKDLENQQPSGCLCFGTSQSEIDQNKEHTNAALDGYKELDPKSVLYHLMHGEELNKHQAARDLMILMRYNLDPSKDYKTHSEWVTMADAVLAENEKPEQSKPKNNDKILDEALNQMFSAAFTQMLALHFLASRAKNQASFAKSLQDVFSNLFNSVQNRTTCEIAWETIKNTLANLKHQVPIPQKIPRARFETTNAQGHPYTTNPKK